LARVSCFLVEFPFVFGDRMEVADQVEK
jgi:hypothetical protein